MAVRIDKAGQDKSGPGNRPGARYRAAADPAVVGPQLDTLAARQVNTADMQLHTATLKSAAGKQPPSLLSAASIRDPASEDHEAPRPETATDQAAKPRRETDLEFSCLI
jgi:hypothetical protein